MQKLCQLPKLETLMDLSSITLSEIRKIFKVDFATMSGIIGLLKNAGIASIKEGRYSFVKNETALQDFIDEHCFEKVKPSKKLFDENDAYNEKTYDNKYLLE